MLEKTGLPKQGDWEWRRSTGSSFAPSGNSSRPTSRDSSVEPEVNMRTQLSGVVHHDELSQGLCHCHLTSHPTTGVRGYWMSTTGEGMVVVSSMLAAQSTWGGVAPGQRKSWKYLSSLSAVPKEDSSE